MTVRSVRSFCAAATLGLVIATTGLAQQPPAAPASPGPTVLDVQGG